jgi:allantoicase
VDHLEHARWTEAAPRSELAGDTENRIRIESDKRTTHLRFHIYPDGGVARLRVYGIVAPDPDRLAPGREADLAALENGGLVVDASDMFFGTRHNLILPGGSLGIHDGWETRRRRGAGHDWAIVQLGVRGEIRRVVVDTSHFKGNAPGGCSLDVADAPQATAETIGEPDVEWTELLPRVPLSPDSVHRFEGELRRTGPATHARLNIFPDGGVARLRLYGVRR